MLSSHKYYRKITIDSTNIDSDLSHFPLPVPIGTAVGMSDQDVSDIFDEVGSDYLKLAVTQADGETQLYVEVEQWDATNEKGLLWVSSSSWSIASASDTEIYLYFDSTAADNTTYVGTPGSRTEVWNSDFLAAYHLSSDASDSTSNNNNGTWNGTEQYTTGQLAQAGNFETDVNGVALPDLGITTGNDWSVSCWVNIPSSTTNGYVICLRETNNIKLLVHSDTQLELDAYSASDDDNFFTTLRGIWTHIVITYDSFSGYANVFVDNSKVVTDANIGGAAASSHGLGIGFNPASMSSGITGKIDQVSFFNKVLSALEIQAKYHAQTDNLLTWGATEVVDILTDSPTNIASDSATLNGTLNNLNSESSLDVYFEYGTDTSYGSTTPAQTISSVPTSFSAGITGLTAFTTYHYRAVATDGIDTWYGDDVSFFATDFTYIEDEGSEFETGTLTDVEVVDTNLELVEAEPDYSLSFDGTDDQVVGDPAILSALSGTDFTFAFWMYKPDATEATAFGFITSSFYDYLIIRESTEWENFKLSNGTQVDAPFDGYRDRWTHVIVTYDDSTSEMRVYFDNSLQGSDSSGSGSIDLTGEIAAIGYDGRDMAYFNGQLGDIHVFNRVINATERGTLYGTKYEALGDEIVYYPTNEGTGTVLTDYSGNGNDGTINGATWTVLGGAAGYLESGNRITPAVDISVLDVVDDSLVRWTSTEPASTSIVIESSISTDGGSSWDAWQACTDSDIVPGLSALSDLTNTYVRFKQSLSTTDTSATPSLEAFEVYIAEETNILIDVPISRVVSKSFNPASKTIFSIPSSDITLHSFDSTFKTGVNVPLAQVSVQTLHASFGPIFVPKAQVSFKGLNPYLQISGGVFFEVPFTKLSTRPTSSELKASNTIPTAELSVIDINSVAVASCLVSTVKLNVTDISPTIITSNEVPLVGLNTTPLSVKFAKIFLIPKAHSSIMDGYSYLVGIAVGDNDDGQCDVDSWINIIAVHNGEKHSLGLKSDGTVVAAGYSGDGQCNVGSWTDIIAIGAGDRHSLGLKSDGTVVATGRNGYGQCDVGSWTDIIAIGAGWYFSLGAKSDGTAVAVGHNVYGQCDVGSWTDIIAISGGGGHSLGLKSDGTAVATGKSSSGQCNVGSWTDIIAISVGNLHSLGLKSDGTVVAVGSNYDGQCDGIDTWTDIIAISAGDRLSLGLKSDGTVFATGYNSHGQCDVGSWTDIIAIDGGYYHTTAIKENSFLEMEIKCSSRVPTSRLSTITLDTSYIISLIKAVLALLNIGGFNVKNIQSNYSLNAIISKNFSAQYNIYEETLSHNITALNSISLNKEVESIYGIVKSVDKHIDVNYNIYETILNHNTTALSSIPLNKEVESDYNIIKSLDKEIATQYNIYEETLSHNITVLNSISLDKEVESDYNIVKSVDRKITASFNIYETTLSHNITALNSISLDKEVESDYNIVKSIDKEIVTQYNIYETTLSHNITALNSISLDKEVESIYGIVKSVDRKITASFNIYEITLSHSTIALNSISLNKEVESIYGLIKSIDKEVVTQYNIYEETLNYNTTALSSISLSKEIESDYNIVKSVDRKITTRYNLYISLTKDFKAVNDLNLYKIVVNQTTSYYNLLEQQTFILNPTFILQV